MKDFCQWEDDGFLVLQRLKGPAWSWWCLSFALQRYTRCSEAESLVGAGEVQCINNTSRMTNRLFLLSDYCFGLSYLWILQWLSSLTAGVSDVVEGIGSSVHLEIFFSQSCPECWDDAFIFTWQLAHMSVATVCIDLVYGSFLRMGSLQLSAHICFCFFYTVLRLTSMACSLLNDNKWFVVWN